MSGFPDRKTQLAAQLGKPEVPESVVLIHRDGSQRALEERLPRWIMPSIFIALGIGLAIFAGDGLVERASFAVVCFAVAGGYDLRAQRRERHLVFDGTDQMLRVFRGRKSSVEVPFSDIDRIYVQVVAEEGYADRFSTLAEIGAARLRLTGIVATRDDALETAKAVAEFTGAEREPEVRRVIPD